MKPFSSTYSDRHNIRSKITIIQSSKFPNLLLICHIETEQDPGEAPGHRSFSVSPISCLQVVDSSLQTSLSSKGKVQRAAYQGREGIQKQGRSSQLTIGALGQGSYFTSLQFSSVAQLCLTLGDPMNRSTPGLPVHHQLPEFTQTRIHRVSHAIQASHPLLSTSLPALKSLPASKSFPVSKLFA